MNITKEQTGDLTATIKIELSPEDYANQVKTILKDYQKKANMPGFRPGKVPFGMVKKMYGKTITADEVNKIISENLNKYIQEEDIKMLGNPLPNIEKTQPIDFEKEDDMNFYFDIGISPDINIELDENIKVDYFEIQSSKKTIDKFISDIQKRQGEMNAVTESEEGDILKGELENFEGDGDEEKSTNINTDFIKTKSEKAKFIGVKAGDTITFNPYKSTKNYAEAAHILGIEKSEEDKLNKDYNLKVTEINRIKPAELDEKFYTTVFPGADIKTKEEFEKKVEEEAGKDFIKESDKKFMNDFIDEIVKKANLSLPDEFLKRWMTENNENKISKEDIEKDYDNYAKAMKWQLIQNKISEDLGIKVEEKEVRDYIKQYFLGRVNMPDNSPEANSQIESIVDSVLQNKEEVQRIYETLLQEKMKDGVKEKVKLKNKKVTYDEFVKLVNDQ